MTNIDGTKLIDENSTVINSKEYSNSSNLSIIQSESLSDNVLVLRTGISGIRPFLVDFRGKWEIIDDINQKTKI